MEAAPREGWILVHWHFPQHVSLRETVGRLKFGVSPTAQEIHCSDTASLGKFWANGILHILPVLQLQAQT